MTFPTTFSQRCAELFKDHWGRKSKDTPYNRAHEFEPAGLYLEMRMGWHRAGMVLDEIRAANRYREAALADIYGELEISYAVYVTEAELRDIADGLYPESFVMRMRYLRTNVEAERDEDGRVAPEANYRIEDTHPLTMKGEAAFAKRKTA